MSNCTIIIPCYNEEARLKSSAIVTHLTRSPKQSILFVDDGSIDRTRAILERLQGEMPAQISVLRNEYNAGKGEAVRRGLLHALGNDDVQFVGYWDADLATPLEAVDDLLGVLLSRPEIEIVIGSRVKLLGRVIERRLHRHYLGRAFATCASLVLDLPVYDTQCGAKLFRATPDLELILNDAFESRWIFDVELLARFLTLHSVDRQRARAAIYECPLNYWQDVPGSKVRPRDFLRAARELAVIRKKYRVKQRQTAESPVLRRHDSGPEPREEAEGGRVR
jgi:dolichyl-phosphate beta-glucosyltransferase